MVEKVFKGAWFFSLVATAGILLYTYASLPADVVIGAEVDALSITRDTLFYSALGFLTLLNALVFTVSRLFAGVAGFFRTWFFGLMAFFNLFVDVILQFLNVLNSAEKFDYDMMGLAIYGSLALLVFWSLTWPVFMFAQKISGKQPV